MSTINRNPDVNHQPERYISDVEVITRYAKTALPRLDLTHHRQPRSDQAERQVYDVRTRLGPASIAHLVAEYEAGDHTTDLAKRYRIGKGTVIQILHDHGVRMRRQSLSERDLPAASDAYASGNSIAAVAVQFGVSPSALRRSLLAAGVQMRSAGRRPKHEARQT